MIDTHAHLNFSQFSNQIDKIIVKSKKAGVTGIILASSNLKDSRISVELAQKYPNYLFASVGIHPHKTDPENKATIEDQLQVLDNLLASHSHPIVALGETGLDFSPAPPGEEDRSKEEQEKLFEGQIFLAQKYNLPLIIHAREAMDEVLEVLNSMLIKIRENLPEIRVNPRGTFHCYAGGKKRVQKILNLDSVPHISPSQPDPQPTSHPQPVNWYFGFDGNLTYDEGLQNILTMIPEDKILIETDAPFLAPIPHRGETNIPAYLPFIQQKINEILGHDLTKQIIQTTKKLFLI